MCTNCGLTLECDAYTEQTPMELANAEASCAATPQFSMPASCPTAANEIGCCTQYTFPGYVALCFYGTMPSAASNLNAACAGIAAAWDAG
jgi:hypothetical protein